MKPRHSIAPTGSILPIAPEVDDHRALEPSASLSRGNVPSRSPVEPQVGRAPSMTLSDPQLAVEVADHIVELAREERLDRGLELESVLAASSTRSRSRRRRFRSTSTPCTPGTPLASFNRLDSRRSRIDLEQHALLVSQ